MIPHCEAKFPKFHNVILFWHAHFLTPYFEDEGGTIDEG